MNNILCQKKKTKRNARLKLILGTYESQEIQAH